MRRAKILLLVLTSILLSMQAGIVLGGVVHE